MKDKILAWLSDNWKPLAYTAILLALYAMAKWAPDREDERDLLVGLAMAWGVYGSFVPAFARASKKSE